MEPDQFTLISMGLIRYSCGHISGPHEPIPIQFGLWMFFIMLHRYMHLDPKKVFLWRHRFSTLLKSLISLILLTRIIDYLGDHVINLVCLYTSCNYHIYNTYFFQDYIILFTTHLVQLLYKLQSFSRKTWYQLWL